MRNKVINLLLLALLHAPFSFGQQKVDDLRIDTSITGFHFAANYQGTLVFTAHGEADLKTANPSAFSFTIMPKTNYEAALHQIGQLLVMALRDGYIQSDIKGKDDTVIDGNKAYYISLTETRQGTDYKNLIFYAFYIKDGTALLFISGDLDNGKYIESFKRTFFSTKLPPE